MSEMIKQRTPLMNYMRSLKIEMTDKSRSLPVRFGLRVAYRIAEQHLRIEKAHLVKVHFYGMLSREERIHFDADAWFDKVYEKHESEQPKD